MNEYRKNARLTARIEALEKALREIVEIAREALAPELDSARR